VEVEKKKVFSNTFLKIFLLSE